MLEFKTLEDLKKSSFYIENKWIRIVKNHRTNKYQLEYKDYGTILSHHSLISININQIK
jgi:hypothetical protein